MVAGRDRFRVHGRVGPREGRGARRSGALLRALDPDRPGQGNGKLHLLGLSCGGQVGYTLAGDETVQPAGLRNVKGMVALDIGVKLVSEADREFYCAMAASDQALLESVPPGHLRQRRLRSGRICLDEVYREP